MMVRVGAFDVQPMPQVAETVPDPVAERVLGALKSPFLCGMLTRQLDGR